MGRGKHAEDCCFWSFSFYNRSGQLCWLEGHLNNFGELLWARWEEGADLAQCGRDGGGAIDPNSHGPIATTTGGIRQSRWADE